MWYIAICATDELFVCKYIKGGLLLLQPNTGSKSSAPNDLHQPSLADLELTSADRQGRGESGTPDTVPQKQSIEAQSIPYELSSTLEHIVGQLDIITQVSVTVFSLYYNTPAHTDKAFL